jgi:hypothetical protein
MRKRPGTAWVGAFTLAAVVIVAMLVGCSDEKEEPPKLTPEQIAEAMGFRAEVTVPVGEAASVGTFLAAVTYPDGTTQLVEGERDGSVAAVWLCDLGGDGVLELVIVTASAGSGSYGAVAVYRQDGGRFAPVEIAGLDEGQREGYAGNDTFGVTDGQLVRSFPAHVEGDESESPSGGTTRLVYSFDESRWLEEANGERQTATHQ